MDNNGNKNRFFDMNPAEPTEVISKPEITEEKEKTITEPVQKEHPVFDLMASNEAVENELSKKKEEEKKNKKKSALTAFISIIVLIIFGLLIYNINNIFPNKTLLQSVNVSNINCTKDKCSLNIISLDKESDIYYFSKKKFPVLESLENYKDKIVIDIYYNENWGTKTIMDYKLYSKINNEEIKDVNTEDELRSKLDLKG